MHTVCYAPYHTAHLFSPPHLLHTAQHTVNMCHIFKQRHCPPHLFHTAQNTVNMCHIFKQRHCRDSAPRKSRTFCLGPSTLAAHSTTHSACITSSNGDTRYAAVTIPQEVYAPSVLGPPHLLHTARNAKLLLPQPHSQSPDRPPPAVDAQADACCT